MHRAWVVAVIIAATAGLLVGAAEVPAGLVFWSTDRPLSWSDFRATLPAGIEQTNLVASPNLVLRWSASYSGRGDGTTATAIVASLTVTNALDSSLSWADRARVDGDILHHEQLHFDLREVYRRLLDVSLRPLSLTRQGSAADCVQALKNLVDSTGMAILARANAADAAFDSETAHGENSQAQATWESRVAYLLENPAAAP